MSGHSKWHNIQKTKGAQDAKRAQAFTKIAREMIVAVKEGGSGDPANNSRLAAVIAKAKAAKRRPFILDTRFYRAGLWPRLVGARGLRHARPKEFFHRTCR